MKRWLHAIGAVLLVSGGTASAHEGATGIVKERMDQMEALARAMKRIDQQLKGKRDPAKIATDAELIRAAAVAMPALYPPGSRDGHTEATAAVWEKWPAFVAAAQLLAQEAEKLAAEARSAPEGAAAQFRAVARTCSACHKVFKAGR
ncbi:MAG TPA: cytochrome c [Beijerinckiaceae bacterium]|jgi:cytochrome c556